MSNMIRIFALLAAVLILGSCAGLRRGHRAATSKETAALAARQLVDDLDFDRFKQNIAALAGFESRYWRRQGNLDAGDWIQAQLESYGYTVERQTFTPRGRRGDHNTEGLQRDSIYVTKIGTIHPDRMYIVSGHMDSYNTQSEDQSFAPGANDDGSGTSLVMEAARVFASPDVRTDVSIRFILWNCEETGLEGSRAYAEERNALQGIEEPRGSGLYPEPRWLGMIQHDMMMFDHGMPPERGQPPQADQIERADIDIEYQANQSFGGEAIVLASRLLAANAHYSADYPAEVGQNMSNTDSRSFAPYCPAVSVRENQRLAEIGRGANPNWHKDSDVPETYSDADYRLGFNALQMTVGAIAELAGAMRK